MATSAAKKKSDTTPDEALTAKPISRDPARFVKRLPRPALDEEKARGMAGTYRVIHGSVPIALPKEQWEKNPDGSLNPKFDYATVHFELWPEGSGRDASGQLLDGRVKSAQGDEIYLSDIDAYRLLQAGIVETLDAKPSRCGKVWEPPKVVRNAAAMMG